MATYDLILADSVRVGNIDNPVKATLAGAADTIGVAPGLNALIGLQLFELVTITQAEQTKTTYHMLLADVTKLQDRVLGAYTRTVADTIELDAAIACGRAVYVVESLGLVDALIPAVRYHKTLRDAVAVSAEVARFFGAMATDSVAVTTLAVGDAYKGARLDEAAQIAAAVTPRFVLRVDAADTIDIDAVEAVRMAFNGTLHETIEITAAHFDPGGSVTTWVMNTRTASVTEYQNYAFNSFAQVGHKYLGASNDGLYELVGDTDDGDDIIATIRSGFAQWSGPHLGAFKAVYLAVRGTGDFVLRILTGDGKTYNYATAAESMVSTKIHTGKGLRARYFAFELVSTGQDFDLDTLEFVPLTAKRRV